ncbi:hypothetical protein [Ruegeria arenilitoris]|uniref:hypothetical protein n=1 Tax=Ruegeria arenilitoris TaxID=1173585 RepID=UPI00147ACC3D|nr:hypothetical protein [Ruegeria arenilitoris]
MRLRILATLAGIALAGGLALAARGSDPKVIAERQLSVPNSQIAWSDWDPEAIHTITVNYGQGQPDDHFSYSVADWAQRNGDTGFETVLALQGYVETDRSPPRIVTTEEPGSATATAVTTVNYDWQGHAGAMRQTDRFSLKRKGGKWVIRALDTTKDYR